MQAGNRAVFIDRDGTIARDVHYCSRPEDFELLPKAAEGVRLLNQRGFKVVVITNQSGIARGYFTEEILAKIHLKMKEELAKGGAFVDSIYYCPHHPDDGCQCRKPKPKLMLQAVSDLDINLSESYVIGDLDMDIEMGWRVGCKTLLVGDPPPAAERAKPDAIAGNFLEAAQTILRWENENQ